MGKGWLRCVSVACLSRPGKEKKHQKPEKPKRKWSLGKHKSTESSEPSLVDPSSSSVQPPSHPLRPPGSASNTDYGDSKEAKSRRKALALASAVAAEAAVVAANAAAEVVRLTTPSTHQTVVSKEENAAIKIQNMYRCHKARHTLRELQGMARLKTLLQGQYVKRQMNSMLSSMQNLTRIKIQIQERKNQLSEQNETRHRLIQQKGHQKDQNQNLVIAGDFDSSNKSKEQIVARSANRKEASVRRERALAYAYSHQQAWRNSSKLPHKTLMDTNTTDWGWSWLERWMASRPWDLQSNDDQVSLRNSLKRENSIKSSPARSLKSASQRSVQWPASNDFKSKNSNLTSRRHSIGGGSFSSLKDDQSVGSSTFSRKNSLDNRQAMKTMARVGTKRNLDNTQALISKSIARTTGNLANTQAAKSKVNVGITNNLDLQRKKIVPGKKKPPQVVLSNKRLSSSTSVGKPKLLSDSDKAITSNGEKKR